MKSIDIIDNEMYRYAGHTWWDEDASAASLRYMMNPVRFGYFKSVLEANRASCRSMQSVLDVGCGGGLLAEEFAKHGYTVTGVDPAEESLACARKHTEASKLKIEYRLGKGEALPFEDASFDMVLCCDVLEHVDDVVRVLGELARVLRPGGLCFYDTVNRTFASKLTVIKIGQEWRGTAFNEANTHVWSMFIKPKEMVMMMAQKGLISRGLRGISPGVNPISMLLNLRRRVKGKIDYRELARRIQLHESDNTSIAYMGYAIRA
jgi:2-polyprenyl-6-hydroxyphenyl methylase / 3-demethylubiquinone-9 3-methyltransferase